MALRYNTLCSPNSADKPDVVSLVTVEMESVWFALLQCKANGKVAF